MGLSVGMQGSVNLEGMDVGGIPCRIGTNAQGVIVEIGDDALTIRLNEPFGGVQVLEGVKPVRFSAPAE
jgi:hypothetical protein